MKFVVCRNKYRDIKAVLCNLKTIRALIIFKSDARTNAIHAISTSRKEITNTVALLKRPIESLHSSLRIHGNPVDLFIARRRACCFFRSHLARNRGNVLGTGSNEDSTTMTTLVRATNPVTCLQHLLSLSLRSLWLSCIYDKQLRYFHFKAKEIVRDSFEVYFQSSNDLFNLG